VSYKIKKHVKTAWLSTSSKPTVKKPWGKETSWAGFHGIHGKTLFIEAGKRTSFKYHKMKSEVLFLRSGRAEVLFGNEESLDDPLGHPMTVKIMNEGDTLLVQSCSPYRITALDACEFVEIGDNSSDPPVRIEDDYGR
jgi:mannose-6-phosphate isomerase-like protein (cupin superfamily)